jgi:hypothetical protein
MPAEAYLEDLLDVVEALGRLDVARAMVEHEFAGEPPTALNLDVHVFSDDFRDAVGVQQGLLLSLEAAAVFVEVALTDRPFDREVLEAVARDRPVDLTIVDLSGGSWRFILKVVPRTKASRGRILAVAGVAVVAGGAVFTGAAVPIALAGSIAVAVNAFLPEQAQKPEPVPLKTVDPTNLPDFQAQIDAESPRDAPADTPPSHPHVYDIDVDGASDANQALLDSIRRLDSVDPQSRYIRNDTNIINTDANKQRIRVWSSTPLTPDQLSQLASNAGTKIVAITPA